MREYIRGTEVIDDIRLGHMMNEVEAIKKIVYLYKPDTFVEVGVHEGGLSYLLIPYFDNKVYYVGVEIDRKVVVPQVQKLYGPGYFSFLYYGDCLNPTLLDTVRIGKTLVYCDNGHKLKEMEFFAPLVKRDDLLLCHDYLDPDRKMEGVLEGYGKTDLLSPPEVHKSELKFLFDSYDFVPIPEAFLTGTRIMGFIRK
jgi:hypothetical protein